MLNHGFMNREITQREKQLVLFTGNHYVYTPYKVKTQTTKVVLTTDKAPESYSKVKPSYYQGFILCTFSGLSKTLTVLVL